MRGMKSGFWELRGQLRQEGSLFIRNRGIIWKTNTALFWRAELIHWIYLLGCVRQFLFRIIQFIIVPNVLDAAQRMAVTDRLWPRIEPPKLGFE
jgi:hypothetical protein